MTDVSQSDPSQTEQLVKLLSQWAERALDANAFEWVQQQREKIAQSDKKSLFLSFGLASRKVGKDDLVLNEADFQDAEQICKDWSPNDWTIDQTVRTIFVMSYPSGNVSEFLSTLDQLFSSGEVRELVMLYKMLPLFPNPEQYALRAAEGVRTNMKSVFCAVAHNNPFPFRQFNEASWNQMVLKSLFIEVPLWPIIGLDERANASLSRMLCDYAHERWAAGRMVSPELWRCVGPFADESAVSDLKHVLSEGTDVEKEAAALSLCSSDNPEAETIMKSYPELASKVHHGEICWDSLSKQL